MVKIAINEFDAVIMRYGEFLVVFTHIADNNPSNYL